MKIKNEEKKLIEMPINSQDEISENNSFEKGINNNFLEEFKDIFETVKIIRKEFIYKIYKAKNIKENRDVCLKVYDKKTLELGDYDYFLEQIKREEEIINICKSEHIVNIYTKLETKNSIIFEMEYVDIDLNTKYIKKRNNSRMNIDEFTEILYGITDALKILNEKGIMHRNIKPNNIFLLGKNQIKLGCFDHAIYIKDKSSEQVGSYFYAAPEIIKNLEYDENCDLWSLGITLHELFFGVNPYGKCPTINIIKNAIYYEDNFYTMKSKYKQVNELLKKLLVINSKNRMSLAQYFDYIKEFKKNIEQEIKDGIKNPTFFSIFVNNSTANNPFYKPDDDENDANNYLESKFMSKIMNIIEAENLESMKIIREEILKKLKNDKRLIFNLITSGQCCEKIINFINENKDFENCIKNIFLLSN